MHTRSGRFPTTLLVWWLVGLLPLLVSCRTVTRLELPAARVDVHEPVSRLMAGVAETDITPPAGFPIAGYSSNGQVGQGFRTRLRARAFYIAAPEQEPLLILQTDLLSGSSLLQRAIAQRVVGVIGLGLHNIMMGATHTHGGPGQFLDSDFYNRFASSRAGLDPELVEFLTARLSEVAIQAYRSRAPARLATGQAEVWGLTRNRSLDPYVHNAEVEDKRGLPQQKYHAVNPILTLIRLDLLAPDGRYLPKGALSFFSIHGTGVPSRSDLFSADVWAYLAEELETQLERHYRLPWRPIHGGMEGTHGDMAPALRANMAGFIESRRIGLELSRRAFELFVSLDPLLTEAIRLQVGLQEVDAREGPSQPDAPGLCRPYVGAALVAGAFENTTPFIHKIPLIAPGFPRLLPRGCQRHKRILTGSLLQPLILPTDTFPRLIPIQLVRIGDVLIAGLPFEVPVMTGRRLAAAATEGWKEGGGGAVKVVISSVANGYFGYAVTPQEFTRQFYEGGHTLYGPSTEPFLSWHVRTLAAALAPVNHLDLTADTRVYSLKSRTFVPGLQAGLAPPQPGDAPSVPMSVIRRTVRNPSFHEQSANREAYWEFQWEDLPPEALHWHQPLVWMEVREADGTWTRLEQDGIFIDDQGFDLEVRRVRGRTGRPTVYAARWHNPLLEGGRRPFRFAVLPRGNQEYFYSPEFR